MAVAGGAEAVEKYGPTDAGTPCLSAHLGYLFKELPFERRVGAARSAGFTGIEHPQPFELPASRMATLLADEGLNFAQMAAGWGSQARGEKGLGALPGREAEFRDELERSLDYAEAVGCPFLHPIAGIVPDGLDFEPAWQTYLGNLAHAVERGRARGIRILVEPMSPAAVPGYLISSVEQALEAADRVAPDWIFLLLDAFHTRAVGRDPMTVVAAHAGRIGHVHIADFPGRHEPGTGDTDFTGIIDALRAAGYRHAVGFEYVPRGATTAEGLGWLPQWRQRLGCR